MILSATIHVVALGALVLALGFSHPAKPPEIQWIDMKVVPMEMGTSAPDNSTPPALVPKPPVVASSEPPNPPATERQSEPTPHPVPSQRIEPEPAPPVKLSDVEPNPVKNPPPIPKLTEVHPNPKPAPQVAQPVRKKVKISNKKVTHVVGSSPPVGVPAKSSATSSPHPSFGKTLLAKLGKNEGLVTSVGSSGAPAGAPGTESKFAAYYGVIYQELYSAWQPPLGLADEAGAKVLLRIEKNGVISRIALAVSSGNKALDDSALEAPHVVKKLPSLPEGLGSPNPYAEVIVVFKIQKS